MPVIPGNQAYTTTVQAEVNKLKANPEFYNILGGAAGYSQEPALTIANEIMCRILAEGMPWKWNRAYIPPFITASLQQDYMTQITDIGWLESAWRVDINNSTSNANRAPKPIFSMETVRDLDQTSFQGVPFNISFIPNSLAFLGTWEANTAYGCGYGQAQTPVTPIQQFMDINGNLLYIDSTVLGLNIQSPGYTNFDIPLVPNQPYGTSGATQPAAVPNATPGSLVQDGSVIWTVADPNGYSLRLSPLPALNGLAWLINPAYQIQPPVIPNLQTPLNPIPNQMMYLFRQGFRAMLKQFNGSKDAGPAYAEWEEQLTRAVRAADRQQEDNCFYPGQSLMGNNPFTSVTSIGAAYPFSPGPWF